MKFYPAVIVLKNELSILSGFLILCQRVVNYSEMCSFLCSHMSMLFDVVVIFKHPWAVNFNI